MCRRKSKTNTMAWPNEKGQKGKQWSTTHIRIDGVIVSVLASSAVDRGFEPRSGQTKDYKIDMCCFPAKHAALRRQSKDWLTRNHDNVSEGWHVYPRTVVSLN
jgi:hypothetical protein